MIHFNWSVNATGERGTRNNPTPRCLQSALALDRAGLCHSQPGAARCGLRVRLTLPLHRSPQVDVAPRAQGKMVPSSLSSVACAC